jgi:aldehyde:ferredoxin oxidoreductase
LREMGKKGYLGKILRVDLTKGKTTVEDFPDELARKFLGANGLAIHTLYWELRPGIDPLGKENKIVFGAGPLVGTILPFISRTYVASKSPLTGLFADATAGGFWSAELKYAGYDAVIVEGLSKEPVYLWVKDGKAEIRDAGHLWGKTTYEAQETICRELGERRAQSVCIGPAGENRVRYAGVFAGVHAAARCGLGAVMGSKGLKAITVKGSMDVEVADMKGLKEWLETVPYAKFPGSGLDKGYSSRGTMILPELFQQFGLWGTENWSRETYDESGETLFHSTWLKGQVRRNSCFSCVATCPGVYRVPDGPYQGTVTEGPEYETVYALGSMCLVPDIRAVVKFDRLCDEYGLDSISTGVTLAFAMECVRRGLISRDQLDGIDLRFGNAEAMIQMIEKIVKREGIGDLLAEGTRIASQKIGKGSEAFAINTKGLEHPGHSTRGTKGMGLGFAVGTRGAHHHDGRDFEYAPNPLLDYDGNRERATGKGAMQGIITRWTAAADCMGYCHFAEKLYGIRLQDVHVKMLNLVTGFDFTLEELVRVGERVYTLERLFQVREGVSRKDDRLPERFFKESIPGGPHRGAIMTKEELDLMLDEFYESHGWDRNGIPTRKRLKELGLEDYLPLQSEGNCEPGK